MIDCWNLYEFRLLHEMVVRVCVFIARENDLFLVLVNGDDDDDDELMIKV